MYILEFYFDKTKEGISSSEIQSQEFRGKASLGLTAFQSFRSCGVLLLQLLQRRTSHRRARGSARARCAAPPTLSAAGYRSGTARSDCGSHCWHARVTGDHWSHAHVSSVVVVIVVRLIRAEHLRCRLHARWGRPGTLVMLPLFHFPQPPLQVVVFFAESSYFCTLGRQFCLQPHQPCISHPLTTISSRPACTCAIDVCIFH